MAIALVQQAPEISATGANGSTTLTVTAGSLLVLTFQNIGSTGDLTSVTDSRGNVWTRDKTYTTGNTSLRVSIYSAPNCAAGSTTVTANFSGGSAYRCQVAEFSGAATSSYVDTSALNTDDTTNAPTSAPSPGLTIANGSVAVLTAVFDRSPSPSPSAGYAALTTSSGVTFAAYKVFPSGASGERGAFNSSATHYDAVIVAYKAGAAPADLSGNVTLDTVAPAGTLADAGPTSLSGNVTLDVVAPAGTLGLEPGTVTVPALRNWSGSLQTSVTIPVVTVLSMTTGAQVLALTDQTTHGTTADLTITSTSLAAGTTYMVAGWNADGSQRFAVPLTATA